MLLQYLQHQLVNQHQYIYIVKYTLNVPKDSITVSLPVCYLARATPSQQQASAPPEVQMRTWHPTSAPRHKAATPDTDTHKPILLKQKCFS